MLAGLWLWCVSVLAGLGSGIRRRKFGLAQLAWFRVRGISRPGSYSPFLLQCFGVVLHPLVECFYVYIALTDSELLLTVARIGTEKKQLFKPYVVATNTFLISKNCLVPWTSAL